MVKHYCNKETEISQIHTMVKSINKALMGNGQPGMLAEFNQLKGAMRFIWGFIGIFGVSILALMIFLIKFYSGN